MQEVVGVMKKNIDKLLDRDVALNNLMTRADDLESSASTYNQTTKQLRRKYWWKNAKVERSPLFFLRSAFTSDLCRPMFALVASSSQSSWSLSVSRFLLPERLVKWPISLPSLDCSQSSRQELDSQLPISLRNRSDVPMNRLNGHLSLYILMPNFLLLLSVCCVSVSI